ncbi:MAG: zinc ribbon domain-containing protein [Fischerella sp. CENA71]|nr:zinc ribbon domain-containing protein [Fischerella sp. CENA71]
MQCKFCGYSNSPEANFCINCGERVQIVKAQTQKQQTSKVHTYLPAGRQKHHVLIDPVGEVHTFSQELESSSGASERTILVWRFRVYVFDQVGNLTYQIPVEMRSKSFTGSVRDGDIVKLPGRWSEGEIYEHNTIINKTLGIQVFSRSDLTLSEILFGGLVGLFLSIIFICVGVGFIITTETLFPLRFIFILVGLIAILFGVILLIASIRQIIERNILLKSLLFDQFMTIKNIDICSFHKKVDIL